MDRPIKYPAKEIDQLSPKYEGPAILNSKARVAIWNYIVWLEQKAGDRANQKAAKPISEGVGE